MRFKDVQDLMLPPVNGVQAHITVPSGDFGAGEAQGRRDPSTIPHTGVDMNYVGGQSGINLRHPDVHSPVSGTVREAGHGKTKRISIEDANGVLHQILHTKDQFVAAGQKVFAGEKIGSMGNSGTSDQHVHYQIKDAAGNLLNPHNVWEQYLAEYRRYLAATAGGSSAETGDVHDVWQRQVSPNMLSADMARRFAASPRAASIPFLDATTRALRGIDNQFPAPGGPPWDLSNRFGNWRGLGGVLGPASDHGNDTPPESGRHLPPGQAAAPSGGTGARGPLEDGFVDAPAVSRRDIRRLTRKDAPPATDVFTSGTLPLPYLQYR